MSQLLREKSSPNSLHGPNKVYMELEPACSDFSCIWQAAVRTQSTQSWQNVRSRLAICHNLATWGPKHLHLSLRLLTTQLECPLQAACLSTLTQMEQTFLMVLGLNNCWGQPPPCRDGPQGHSDHKLDHLHGIWPLSSTLALEGVSNQSFKPLFGNIDAILIHLLI